MQFLDLSLSISPIPRPQQQKMQQPEQQQIMHQPEQPQQQIMQQPEQRQQKQPQQQKQGDDQSWSTYQRRCFRKALSEFSTDTPDFFEKVAAKVPKKSMEQVKEYFQSYKPRGNMRGVAKSSDPNVPTSSTNIANSRKRPPIWTRNEHENFLLGIKRHGKLGKWKEIAFNLIPSKTAAQVSAHAQEFFKDEKKSDKKSGRASESSKNADTSTITATNAAALAAITNTDLGQACLRSKRKVLDSFPDILARKVPRTLNLFPLVSTVDYASSSWKQEEKEDNGEQGAGGEDCTLKLFPTHPTYNL